ncbi:MAG TPA: NAD(P)/FAD-dependent oxidoreductase [Longimicrobiales bacterium]|nr:NAD(P)/FAD-dependent oxidoreductase [Longimicrobiales bacterium]
MSRAAAGWDVVVVGGGPAGLSAALWLARYRRRALVLDAGRPRNRVTWAVHGFPGLPDLPPDEIRARLREQAMAAGAEFASGTVRSVEGAQDAFTVRTDEGAIQHARRVLLAFGLRDLLPELPGLEEAFGQSAFHCPDCDGPSVVGAPVAVYGRDREAAALALYLLTWASSVQLLTDGAPNELRPEELDKLRANDIQLRTERVRRIVAAGGRLERIELDAPPAVTAEALFFHLGARPACDIAEVLGCDREGGQLTVDHAQETSIRGVFAAGDLAGPPYLAVSAAASGVRAALAIHRSLLPASRHL